jgi:hypothetical protein
MGGPNAIIYTAENTPTRGAPFARSRWCWPDAASLRMLVHRVQFLDTIIGKMSGVPESDDLASWRPAFSVLSG